MSSQLCKMSSSSAESIVHPLIGEMTSSEEMDFWDLHPPTRVLGTGAFGSVIAATRLEDGAQVAVKVQDRSRVPYETDEDGDGFPEEVIALNKVMDIPGTINYLDMLDTPDKVMIILEHPPNSTDLKTFIDTHGPLPETMAKKLTSQLVTTVNQMMDSGVLHRDLKVENILIQEDTLQTKIIDFGLTSTVSSNLQSYRSRMGTRTHHPPENYQKRRFIAGPGTVWALGVIAFKLLSGFVPFKDEEETIRASPNYPSNISPACLNFLKRCFAHKAFDRLPLDKMLSHPWLFQTPSYSSEDSDYSSQPSSSSSPEQDSSSTKYSVITSSKAPSPGVNKVPNASDKPIRNHTESSLMCSSWSLEEFGSNEDMEQSLNKQKSSIKDFVSAC